MRINEILAEIQERQRECIEGRVPSEEDVVRWCGVSLERISGPMLDEIALGIARQYQSGVFSFELADAVMNEFYSLFICAKQTQPDIFMGPFFVIFDAFDAGEWHRKPDKSDDPIAEYTNPLIAKCLKDNPA